MKRIATCLLVLCALALPGVALGQEITVAVASDLTFAMNELAPGFEHATGHKIKVSTGSSGNFFAQIQNGAPFDVFLSADVDYPRQLEAAGLIEPGTLYVYAIGRIVVWAPLDSPLDVSRGWAALTDPRVKKIAIANPAHAPYGRAADAAMRSAGVYDRIAGKLVLGENISQAAQFVDSGNAEIGILALSLASAANMKNRGRWWLIPENSYPLLEQGAAVLRSSRNKDAARAFLTYLQSAEGRAILQRHGFSEAPIAAGAARP